MASPPLPIALTIAAVLLADVAVRSGPHLSEACVRVPFRTDASIIRGGGPDG